MDTSNSSFEVFSHASNGELLNAHYISYGKTMQLNFLKNQLPQTSRVPGRREIAEAALLFAAFFLPGYLSQPLDFDPSLFTSPSFHGMYLLHTIPRIGLILYLLLRTRPGSLGRYGLRKPVPQDFTGALPVFFGALGISMAVSLLAFHFGLPGPFDRPAGGSAGDVPLLLYPLLLITCLTIGYYEELFFRAYLLGEFARSREARLPAAAAASLLFAAGHGYQGLVGFGGTFLIGLFFAFRFLRRASLHELAIGHGLYNCAAVLILIHLR
jgi:hypothetical protein